MSSFYYFILFAAFKKKIQKFKIKNDFLFLFVFGIKQKQKTKNEMYSSFSPLGISYRLFLG